MAAFTRPSLAERLGWFEQEVNDVDKVKSKLQVERVGVVNSGEVILAQLFRHIERTMAKVMDINPLCQASIAVREKKKPVAIHHLPPCRTVRTRAQRNSGMAQ